MSAEVVRINQDNECSVVSFPVKEDIKLTKNGEIKKTPNNTESDRDTILPIKKDDIPKFIKHYKSRIDNAIRLNNELSARRDLSMFIMGINIALRISDLITLRWSDVYKNDWTFKDGKVITPKKTKNRNKHVLLEYNPDFKEAIELYRFYCDKPNNMKSYIFIGTIYEKGDDKNEEGHISDAAIESSLKNAVKAIGIDYPICTHSLRKTFCRLRYDEAEDKSDMLIRLMDLLEHSSIKQTKKYIGISKEEKKQLFNMISIGCKYIYDDTDESDDEECIQNNLANRDTITIDKNTLNDIIKMVYQDGMNNAQETDYNVHMEAIEAAMEIVMDSVI